MPEPAGYRLVRSRRRTLAVCIEGGRVTVRAPLGMPAAAIDSFLAQKKDWIEGKLRRFAAESARFAAVREGRALLDAGRERPVVFGAAADGEGEGGFFLRSPRSVRPYFEKTRCDLLPEALFAFARRAGVCPEKVAVRDFKARWGSCDAARVIKLNWRLAMLPAPLRDYVLVHELCHLRRLDHSPAFWREVERLLPDYRARRAALRAYSFLTGLYRG